MFACNNNFAQSNMHDSFHKGVHHSCQTSSNLGHKRSYFKGFKTWILKSLEATNVSAQLIPTRAKQQSVDLTPCRVLLAPPDVWTWALNNLRRSWVFSYSSFILCCRLTVHSGPFKELDSETQHSLTWLNLNTGRQIITKKKKKKPSWKNPNKSFHVMELNALVSMTNRQI